MARLFVLTPLALSALLLGFAPVAMAQYQAGKEYLRLDPPPQTNTDKRIEVIEFFYYGCPICYEFQPHFSRWQFQTGDDVTVLRVPALSTEAWESMAKLYYALDAMGEATRLHWPVYDNFHFDGIKLNEPEVMLDWVSRNGVNREKFAAAMESAEVRAKLQRSREMIKLYEIRGVPSIVVDGRYLSSARLAGGTRELSLVLDFLVKLVRTERGQSSATR